MDWPVMQQILDFLLRTGVPEVDITGGAPEKNPWLEAFVTALRKIPTIEKILLRTNLAILEEAAFQHLPEFFARQGVELIASLPCYELENVDFQRGAGVYDRNIRILKQLNRLGFGQAETTRRLSLVYNPGAAFLPGSQEELEDAYREELWKRHGICFNQLFTITNMPLGRFRRELEATGELQNYYKLLIENFNAVTLGDLMCLSTLSVDWQGRLYDCDFNQALRLPLKVPEPSIDRVTPQEIALLSVATGLHCFGCTAGAGSS